MLRHWFSHVGHCLSPHVNFKAKLVQFRLPERWRLLNKVNITQEGGTQCELHISEPLVLCVKITFKLRFI